mgnify:FL=1
MPLVIEPLTKNYVKVSYILEQKVYLPCKVLTILQMHDIIIEAKFKDCSSIPCVFGSVSIETFFTITSANSFKRTCVTGKGLFLVC